MSSVIVPDPEAIIPPPVVGIGPTSAEGAGTGSTSSVLAPLAVATAVASSTAATVSVASVSVATVSAASATSAATFTPAAPSTQAGIRAGFVWDVDVAAVQTEVAGTVSQPVLAVLHLTTPGILALEHASFACGPGPQCFAVSFEDLGGEVRVRWIVGDFEAGLAQLVDGRRAGLTGASLADGGLTSGGLAGGRQSIVSGRRGGQLRDTPWTRAGWRRGDLRVCGG